MTSTDTLLNYVFRIIKSNNKLSETKITQIQALKIYHDVINARQGVHTATHDVLNRFK